MSDVVLSSPALPTGDPYFEQRIFIWSPLGTFATTAVLFAILYGLYLAAAFLEGGPSISIGDHGISFRNAAWPALVLSLLICASLGMQRYARLKDAEDFEKFAPIFSGGEVTAQRLTSYAPNNIRLANATVSGLLVGGLVSVAIVKSEALSFRPDTIWTNIWIIVATLLLSMLFARGAQLSRKSSASFSITLRDELKIDLLRLDKLSVIGRSAARTALIWIVVSAIAGLFFVGGDISIVSVGTMVACAAMGVLIFMRAIMGVHHRIRAAKASELEHVRSEIDRARADLPHDPQAASRVQGLLAYEHRIDSAPEWPFDQTTLMRVGASTLIVTVPWFGQAIAGYLIDHLAH